MNLKCLYVICVFISVVMATPRSHKHRHLKKLHGDKALVSKRLLQNESPKKQYVPAIMIVQNLPGSNSNLPLSNFPLQQNWIPGGPGAVHQGLDLTAGSHFGGLPIAHQTLETPLNQALVQPCNVEVMPAYGCKEIPQNVQYTISQKQVHAVYPARLKTVPVLHKTLKVVPVVSTAVRPAVVEVAKVKHVPVLIDPSEGPPRKCPVSAVAVANPQHIDGLITVDHKPAPAVVTRPVSVSAPATGHQNHTFTIGLDFKADDDVRVGSVQDNLEPSTVTIESKNPPESKECNTEVQIGTVKEVDMTPVSKADDEQEANQGIVTEVANILKSQRQNPQEMENAAEIDPKSGAMVIHTTQLDQPLGLPIVKEHSDVQEKSNTRQIHSKKGRRLIHKKNALGVKN